MYEISGPRVLMTAHHRSLSFIPTQSGRRFRVESGGGGTWFCDDRRRGASESNGRLRSICHTTFAYAKRAFHRLLLLGPTHLSPADADLVDKRSCGFCDGTFVYYSGFWPAFCKLTVSIPPKMSKLVENNIVTYVFKTIGFVDFVPRTKY